MRNGLFLCLFIFFTLSTKIFAADGYNGFLWGESSEILKNSTRNTVNIENDKQDREIVTIGSLTMLFRKILGVRKEKVLGVEFWEFENIPEKFTQYSTDDTNLILYDDKLLSCWFEISPNNYDRTKNEIMKKYGNSTNNNYIEYYDDDYEKRTPLNFTVTSWEKGSTKILLVKQKNRFLDLIETSTYVFYLGSEQYKNLRNEIKTNIAEIKKQVAGKNSKQKGKISVEFNNIILNPRVLIMSGHTRTSLLYALFFSETAPIPPLPR